MSGKFLVFCYPDYYPQGGSGDFEGTFDGLAEAERVAVARAPSDSADGRNAEIYDVAADKWITVSLERKRKAG